jgi:hypothetical protein
MFLIFVAFHTLAEAASPMAETTSDEPHADGGPVQGSPPPNHVPGGPHAA